MITKVQYSRSTPSRHTDEVIYVSLEIDLAPFEFHYGLPAGGGEVRVHAAEWPVGFAVEAWLPGTDHNHIKQVSPIGRAEEVSHALVSVGGRGVN